MKLREEITESAILIMKQLMLGDAVFIDEIFWKEKDHILHELSNCLTEVCKNYQQKQLKEAYLPAEFLSFCYLRSSIVTGSNDLLITLYDEDLYLGKQVSVRWKPEFIMDRFKESRLALEKKLYAHNPSIKSYEVLEYQYMFGYQYFYFILKFLETNMEWIVAQYSIQNLLKTAKFKVTFGGLYERQSPLYEQEKEERQEG